MTYTEKYAKKPSRRGKALPTQYTKSGEQSGERRPEYDPVLERRNLKMDWQPGIKDSFREVSPPKKRKPR